MCGYDEYLSCRIPTLTSFLCQRISKIGLRSYFPVAFDSDNGILSCLGLELHIPHEKLLGALVGEISEFDTDAMEIRVRLKRY